MPRLRKYLPLLLLAGCIAAALAMKRFVFVAWYPVVMSAAVASAFGFSLFGKEPLCLALARAIPPHILPEGCEAYARAYTKVWAAWLVCNGLIAIASIYVPGPTLPVGKTGIDVPIIWIAWNCCLSYCATALITLGEWLIRRRRFASVFHTSGSTAQPKTIVKTFDTLAKEVAFHRARLTESGVLAGEQPVFLSTVEPHHMYGKLWRVLLPRVAGCAVDPAVIRAPEELLARMRAAKQVFLVTTPSFLDRFCAYADQYEVPQNCVEITTSGALLTAETSAAARRVFGIAPLEIFGSTETGGVASRRQTTPNCDWQVFDPVKVAASADGRLVVRSPFSFKRTFVMGDGIILAPDGRSFKLLGRLDRLVKINEQRVSLPEMEEKLKTLPGIREAALVVLDSPRGSILGAVLVSTPHQSPHPPAPSTKHQAPSTVSTAPSTKHQAPSTSILLALRRESLKIFPPGAAPKRFRFVEELPRNAQGKVQAAELRRLFDGGD